MRKLCFKTICLAWALLVARSGVAQEAQLRVAPLNGSGVYKLGEEVQWQVLFEGADEAQASYVIKRGGISEIARGVTRLERGKGEIHAKLDEPGWVLADVTSTNGSRVMKALGGALVEPQQIRPAQPRPADFQLFWQEKLKELHAVAPVAQVSREEPDKVNIDYFKVSLQNIRGSLIQGQLARPKKGEKLPAMLIVQWAGVYPLQKGWVTERAAEGWLVLNINAHDLPIDKPEPFYEDQNKGPLRDYPSIGNDDREKSYFLRMYLSCYRGAQYLVERPDWNGRTLVVTGGSQGGLQSLVTAALHPKVSAVLACVPAGCDLNGPEAGRKPGWPMWYHNVRGKDPEKVRETARYFDVVNFAADVKCPVLIGAGLIDTTCPAPGIFAAFNLISGPKEIVVLPTGEHGDKNGSHRPYYLRFDAWKAALVKGETAPVRTY